jgi:hypothetical protein
VANLLAAEMPALALDLIGQPPTARGRLEWRWRAKGSLGVHVTGPKRGWFHDNEADQHGDALAFVAHMLGVSMPEACRWALGRLGMAAGAHLPAPRPRPPAAPRERPESGTLELARSLWREGLQAVGSPVATYLASRGLTLPDDAPLRFHPACWRNRKNGPHGPAMLAAMTDPCSGAWVGVHVTYLRPDGAGKAEGPGAKIKLGHAGTIRLVPDEDVTTGLGIAEGIETALAVMQWRDWRPVWAAGDVGSIRGFPVLTGIEALTIFADADDGGASMDAARECAERWADAGQEAWVRPAPAGKDFADLTGRAA